MKTNAIVRIVIWSIVLLLLISILGTILLVDVFSFARNDATWVAPIITNGNGNMQQQDYAAPEGDLITRLEIEWAAGTITIQPGDTNQVVFSEQGAFDTDEALSYTHSGNKLTIRYQERNVYIGIHSTVAKDLIITVPRDWSGDCIEIDAAAAQLKLRDISVRELDFDGASGQGFFENCSIEKLDIDTASGDIEFTGTLNTLDFDAMSAKLTATLYNIPRSLELDTMSGDMDLTLPADCGFSVSIDGMHKDFDSDFNTITRDGRHIHGDGSCRIEISAMSGDVNIRKGNTHHIHDETCGEADSTCPDNNHH